MSSTPSDCTRHESQAARRTILERCRQAPRVPVLIIGGGIIGTGLFRELALQGVAALLVERGDFGCGASAAPSRMIHGGLRYLELGDFELVRESVTERNLLLGTAPHCVFALPTTVPVRSRFSGLGQMLGRCLGLRPAHPAPRGALLLKIGLSLYDFLGRQTRAVPTHRFSDRDQALARRPALDPGIVATATYYDAWISYPERLCLELVLDGEQLCPGARGLSYVALVDGGGETVRLRDELAGETYEIRPRLVVNATGAWIDNTNQRLGLATEFIGGTKGGHLILDNPELAAALGDEMILYETPEGRVCIAFVWLGKPLIGSTDIRIRAPDAARCDDSEIDYMLAAIRTPFPGIRVDRSQILSTFSGIRPLAKSSAAVTGQVSRSHHCAITEPGAAVRFPVYSMIGGKWTPFRAFAQQVADRLLRVLAQPRRADSRSLAIGGGRGFPRGSVAAAAWQARLAANTGVPADRIQVWFRRYGTRAAPLAAFAAAGTDAPLHHHSGYTRREIEFMLEQERVCHLDDILLRRTGIALLGELTEPLLLELADIAATALGWSAEQTRAEQDRAREILRERHHVTPR